MMIWMAGHYTAFELNRLIGGQAIAVTPRTRGDIGEDGYIP